MALTKIDDRGLKTPIDLLDNEKIRLGTGNDLEIFHDGSDSWIKDTGTGGLIINSNAFYLNNAGQTENMIKATENGAVELYHDNSKTAWTHGSGFNIKGGNTSDQTELIITGNEGQAASILMSADDGDDNADHWRMYSNADNSFTLTNYTAGSYETNIKATGNGAVELYHDNVKSLSTDATGCTIQKDASNVSAGLTIKATNGGQAKLDLMTSLSGTNRAARIDFHNQGTGQWTIINDYQQNGTNNLGIRHDAEKAIDIYPDGAVELYYDNTKCLETRPDGGIEAHDGNFIVGTSGHGIQFDTGDSGSDQLLDDYEEGTWTPVMKRFLNSTWVDATMTSNGTVQVAKYTKVGNKVQVYLFWDGWQQSNANYSVIGGLPFASNGGGIIIPAYNNAFTAQQNQGGLIGHQSDHISFYYDGTNWNAWSSGSARVLYLGGVYFAT